MKNLIMMAFAMIMTVGVYAQDIETDQVPENFTEGLLEKYPEATDIEWERSGIDYKVEFEVGKMEHEIWFSKDGKMVRVQKELSKIEVPENLAKIIKKDYPDYKIDAIESNFKNGQTTYEVELEKSWNEDLKVTYTVDGKVLKKSKD